MTEVKKLSKERKRKIKNQIEKALLALDEFDDREVALRAVDTAMKLFNGWDDAPDGAQRYDQLHDATLFFLREAGFCSLASLLTFIEMWREQEQFAALGKAAYEAECDMTHYWRCESWQTEDGKRRSSNPRPSDEECTCGLNKIVEAENKIVVKED